MKELFEDHAFLIWSALIAVIVCYTVIVVVGKPVDDRIIGFGFVGLVGGLLGFANHRR